MRSFTTYLVETEKKFNNPFMKQAEHYREAAFHLEQMHEKYGAKPLGPEGDGDFIIHTYNHPKAAGMHIDDVHQHLTLTGHHEDGDDLDDAGHHHKNYTHEKTGHQINLIHDKHGKVTHLDTQYGFED